MVNEEGSQQNASQNDAILGMRPPNNLTSTTDKTMCWKQWIQQFKRYSTAIELDKKPSEVQEAIFMTVIGPEAIEIFNNFNFSDDQKQNLQEVKRKFQEYFLPKTNVSFERFLFHKIIQKMDESFDEFLTRIRTRASTCDFRTLNDEMLKDKIVFGTKSNHVREKLLSETNLDLDKKIRICIASEQATKQLGEFEDKGEKQVLALKRGKSKPSAKDVNKDFNCKKMWQQTRQKRVPSFQKRVPKMS